MDNNRKILLKEYLSNLKVEVTQFGYTKVWPEWRDIDFTPNYNKFYLICDGEGWLKIGNEEYYPKSGQMFLMPEGVLQSYSSTNSNTFIKYWCHFTAKIGDLNLFDIIKLPYFLDVKEFSLLEELFKKMIFNGERDGVTAVLRNNAVILELISYYMENAIIEETSVTKSDSMKRLKIITDFIEDNLHESINIDILAQIVHLHPNYLIKFFKKHLGTSPIHYVNRRRIEEAKRIILTRDYTLAELSSRVGINDLYYFSKLFKEHTGFSPTEYKKMLYTRLLSPNSPLNH